MDKKIFIALTGVAVSGLMGVQARPALAQVQINDSTPSTAASSGQPEQRTQVNVAPAAPSPPPVVINNNGTSEGRLGRSQGGKLMAAGGTIFAVTYLSTVLGAAIASDVCQAESSFGCREAAWPIYLPVVGPFIQMGYLSGTGANTGRAILGIDGALQAGGLAMFIAGAVLWGHNASQPQYARRIQLAPYSTANGTGLLALGKF